MGGTNEAQRFTDQWWAMDGIDVIVEYTDADGGQAMASRASIRQYATKGPIIEELAVTHPGKRKTIATGRGSYQRRGRQRMSAPPLTGSTRQIERVWGARN
jgi:hypothetical protein